jgi:hypothetical protein
MDMSIQEPVNNCIMRGRIANGVITISDYPNIFGTGLTYNCLRGMLAVVNNRVLGYVLTNTAWYDNGITVTLGYNTTTIGGLVDVAFIFPSGRLFLKLFSVATYSQPILSKEHNAQLIFNTQPIESHRLITFRL